MSRSDLWPSVGFERLRWLVAEGGDARRSSRGSSYDSAVTPAISHVDLLIPSECALLSEDVRTAIAAFDLRVGDTLAPLEALLVRIESSASSRIENVTAPIPDLLIAEVDHLSARSAAEVVGNVDATVSAIVLSDELTPETILDIHRSLLAGTHPVLAGRWRDEVVWIGSYSGGPPNATFVPPAVKRIEPAMEDLCDFLARDDIPVFIQAMIMHAQFETIHPFPDGNGRVGRALIHALLRREGLSKAATLPISAGIVSQKHRYIEALTLYRQGDYVPIVELGADATFAALRSASVLADDVLRIREEWSEALGHIRGDAHVHQLLDSLLAYPVVDVSVVEQVAEVELPAARRIIRRLAEVGILLELERGPEGRKRWITQDVVRVLDQFTERSINPFGRH